MRALIALGAVLALSGCQAAVTYVSAHAPTFAAVGIVAGTMTTVEQAVVNADELVVRAKRHVEEAEKK